MKLILIWLLIASYLLSIALNVKVYKITISSTKGPNNSCPLKKSYLDLHHEVNHYFRNTILQLKKLPECGSGLWKEMMNLNMANHSHSCPSGWNVSSNPRACSRGSEFCASTRVPVSMKYSQVCGQVVGSGKRSTNGFYRFSSKGGYVDGITIFRNFSSQEHVWTFANDNSLKCKCPIDTTYTGIVGSNYFCDGNENNVWSDSSGCQSSSSKCCGPSHPPWFSTSLSQRSDEDLLVSICCDEGVKNEDVLVKEVLLYAQ